MQLLPLGVGDAFSARHYTSCLALRAEGEWLLVDCPHPLRKILREGAEAAGPSLDVGDLSGVVLTHLHADHSSGLEDLAFYSRLVLERRVPLLCHPGVSARLWEKLRVTMEHLSVPALGSELAPARLDTWVELTDLDEDAAVAHGPFAIECRRTLHPVFTTALRITGGGRTLGVSSDTGFSPELLEWLGEADLVLHECGAGLHTPYERLAEQPSRLRDRLRLIHLADDFDRDASVIPAVEQGVLYEV